VPLVEYLAAADYRIVPGVGIGSRGPVASVALFTKLPIEDVTTIALDTSSRTSAALVRVLCYHHFRIAPRFVPHGPDLQQMLERADAALLIGDPALEASLSGVVRKLDLGEAWSAMTGLPFVYAAWCGRDGAIGPEVVAALQDAQVEGVRSSNAIAAEYGRGDAARTARAAAYLRDNVHYTLGPDEAKGLQMFLDLAADLGLAPLKRRLEFF
jgi:chorismate dehydratase